MHVYLSLDIMSLSKLRNIRALRSRKTARILEQIMSAVSYPVQFSLRQVMPFYIKSKLNSPRLALVSSAVSPASGCRYTMSLVICVADDYQRESKQEVWQNICLNAFKTPQSKLKVNLTASTQVYFRFSNEKISRHIFSTS